MYGSFREISEAARKRGEAVISVAAAEDRDVIRSLKAAEDEGLSSAVLVGDEPRLKPLIEEAGLRKYRLVHEADSDKAALRAASLTRRGEAGVLMKGQVNSSNFLKAVLDKDHGLKRDRLLSHLAVFEVPGQKKLMFITDGGMNVAPDLAAKKQILQNVLEALANMGYREPKVAVMSHNEQVNEKMASTVDAAALVKMGREGELPPCLIEGPMAMDVAASSEAAAHKKIASHISGEVDVFLMPNIEAGNMVGKTLTYYARATSAGLILGASHPVIMVSRADPPEVKLQAIALAALASGR